MSASTVRLPIVFYFTWIFGRKKETMKKLTVGTIKPYQEFQCEGWSGSYWKNKSTRIYNGVEECFCKADAGSIWIAADTEITWIKPAKGRVEEFMELLSEDKQKEKTLKLSDLKNGDYFKFVDFQGKDTGGPVYQRIKGVNQNTVKISMSSGDGNFVEMTGASLANIVKVDKPTTEEKTVRFSDINVGDWFHRVDRDCIETLKKVSPYSAVEKDYSISYSVHPYSLVVVTKKAEEEKKEKKEKKVNLFSDLKIGDKFKFTDAAKNGWPEKWFDIFTKISKYGIQSSSGEKYDNVGNSSTFTLVEEAKQEAVTEAKTEGKKPLTFGDLEVGDDFIYVSYCYYGGRALDVLYQKMEPDYDGEGWLTNALSVNTSQAYKKQVAFLDHQKIKLVEKKLTIADLKPGEKFTMRDVKDSSWVCTKVYDSKAINGNCAYISPYKYHVLEIKGDTEVERVTEDAPKKITLAQLDVGKKFRVTNGNLANAVYEKTAQLENHLYKCLQGDGLYGWIRESAEVEEVD